MIQNTEFYSSPEQNYLLIHKNACTTIRDNLIKEFGSDLMDKRAGGGVTWAVTRDPYDRLLSALAYDIEVQYPQEDWGSLESIEEILSTIDYTKYIVNNVPHMSNYLGKAQHSVLQTIYLFDNNVDILVDLEDLEHFIPMHFKNPVGIKNRGNKSRKDSIRHILDSYPLRKDFIQSLLEVDYIMLKAMQAQGKVWSWGSGKIW